MDADAALIVVIVMPFPSLVGIAGNLRRRSEGVIFRGFETDELGNDAGAVESG